MNVDVKRLVKLLGIASILLLTGGVARPMLEEAFDITRRQAAHVLGLFYLLCFAGFILNALRPKSNTQ